VTLWPSLSVLPRDVHERGTYAACNKIYDTAATFDTTNGIELYPIGDDDLDTPTTGNDYASRRPRLRPTTTFRYFVSHPLTLASSDGRSLAILINPRGGSWAEQSTPVRNMPGGKFLVPSGRGSLRTIPKARWKVIIARQAARIYAVYAHGWSELSGGYNARTTSLNKPGEN